MLEMGNFEPHLQAKEETTLVGSSKTFKETSGLGRDHTI